MGCQDAYDVLVFQGELGIAAPWIVREVEFAEAAKVLTVQVNFAPGNGFRIVIKLICQLSKDDCSDCIWRSSSIGSLSRRPQTNSMVERFKSRIAE